MNIFQILNVVFVSLSISLYSSAQDSIIAHDLSPNYQFDLTADYSINSTAITNKFIRTFSNGGYISNDIKDKVAQRLRSSNVLGGAAKLGFTYSVIPKKYNTPVFSFSLFDRGYYDLKFSKDLFRTIFDGNKHYEGQTAEIGHFQLNNLRYQQFQFGLKWRGDNLHGSYGFSFSVLNGERNMTVNIPTADLFTSVNGMYLDFNISLKAHQTDPTMQDFFTQSGMGLSTYFFYEMPYVSGSRYGKFKIEISDLGFIRWKANSFYYTADSTFHYDGIYLDDIFMSKGKRPSFQRDSIINRMIKTQRGSYTTGLPFTIHMQTQTWYGRKFSIEKGISFFVNSSARPYVYVKPTYSTTNNKISFAATLGYGGFGRLQLGIGTKVNFAKQFSLLVAGDYILSGYGVYVKLTKKF